VHGQRVWLRANGSGIEELGRLTICSDLTLTNYPDMGTVMSLSLDDRSGEQPSCSGSDANRSNWTIKDTLWSD